MLSCMLALVLLLCLSQATSASSAASSSAPWQSSSAVGAAQSIQEEQTYRGLPPTVFSPTGRLHSVERAVQAASSKQDASANLAVAIQCRSGVVVVTTSTKSPHLSLLSSTEEPFSSSSFAKHPLPEKHSQNRENQSDGLPLWIPDTDDDDDDDNETNTSVAVPPLSWLAPNNIWMVTGGNAVDAAVLRDRLHRMAQTMREEHDDGSPLSHTSSAAAFPVSLLALKAANHLQVPTQSIGTQQGRILACSALLLDRKELWRLDPTGQFWKCHAATVGRGATAAESHLLHLLLDNSDDDDDDDDDDDHKESVEEILANMSTEQAIDMACRCIQKVLPEDEEAHWQALILSAAPEAMQIRRGNDIRHQSHQG